MERCLPSIVVRVLAGAGCCNGCFNFWKYARAFVQPLRGGLNHYIAHSADKTAVQMELLAQFNADEGLNKDYEWLKSQLREIAREVAATKAASLDLAQSLEREAMLQQQQLDTNTKLRANLAESYAKAATLAAELAAAKQQKSADVLQLRANLAASAERERTLQEKLDELTTVTVHNLETGEDEKKVMPAAAVLQNQRRRREEGSKAAAAVRVETSNAIKRIKVERDLATGKAMASEEDVEDAHDDYQTMINWSEKQKAAITKLKELAKATGASRAQIDAAAKVA